jgi:hypothetical protein
VRVHPSLLQSLAGERRRISRNQVCVAAIMVGFFRDVVVDVGRYVRAGMQNAAEVAAKSFQKTADQAAQDIVRAGTEVKHGLIALGRLIVLAVLVSKLDFEYISRWPILLLLLPIIPIISILLEPIPKSSLLYGTSTQSPIKSSNIPTFRYLQVTPEWVASAGKTPR